MALPRPHLAERRSFAGGWSEAAEVASTCTASGCRGILLDVREASLEIGMADRFEGVTALARDLPAGTRVAVREEVDRVIHDTEREFRRFHGQAAALKDQLTAEHGELTPETRAKLDRDMWLHQLKAMAAVDLITTGGLRENTVTFLQACPVDMRAPVLADIRATLRVQQESRGGKEGPLVDWFLAHEPALPETDASLPAPDLRALVCLGLPAPEGDTP